MRSSRTFNRTASQTAPNSFAIRAEAADKAVHVKMAAVFLLALITMIAAGVMTLHPSNASQAEDLKSLASRGVMVNKGDRIAASSETTTCRGETWGAWSEGCAAALTGADRVRNVSFVTVEKSAPTVNETILARYPVTD
ncbi:phosphopantetheine adenylyltransferase [Roseibium sp.]|uniref:phosphopantetheine adenylyltransferase n=1 Tax=Roseibium sp. TaxID=1936156 RepID=UPI003267F86F